MAGDPPEVDLELVDPPNQAPSIDLEQRLYNVLGHGITRIDAELAQKKKLARWILARLTGLALGARRRDALMQRLTGATRTSDAFTTYNRYLMLRLRPAPRG